MNKISYAHHRFPPAVIQRAVWLYFRLPLSFRDIEEMLTERGIVVCYETIRRWVLKFDPKIAAKVSSRRVQPSGTWHPDDGIVWQGMLAYLRGRSFALQESGHICGGP